MENSFIAARDRHDFGVHGTPYVFSLELFKTEIFKFEPET